MQFLLDSLKDLSSQLQLNFNSRLLVLKGNPTLVLPQFLSQLPATTILTYETDTEPYAVHRDAQIDKYCEEKGIKVAKHSTHTLYDLDYLLEQTAYKPPLTY
jgi:cryptochrome